MSPRTSRDHSKTAMLAASFANRLRLGAAGMVPRRAKRPNRAGAILLLTLFFMVVFLSFIALAVDVGYLQVAQSELRRSADSAAIAAAWKLLDEQKPNMSMSEASLALVRSTASDYAGKNRVANAAPALATQDTEVGCLDAPYNSTVPLTFTDLSKANAVTVHIRRTAQQNGEVGLFFARIMGRDKSAMEVEATAAFLNNVAGFRKPASGENLDILPFALDVDTWNGLKSSGSDNYKWDPETKQVTSGSDGENEVNLYPQGTGSPGNRGTVDIGSSNNSTADISRQIREGISTSDLEQMGGKLEFNSEGTLSLNGDTGISAGVKDDLTSIIGKPRIIPIFSAVSGPGNNAQYTIVKFVGVRVMYVKLTGSNSSKKVIIQPAMVVTPGAIPATGTSPTSQYVYSPVWLVR